MLAQRRLMMFGERPSVCCCLQATSAGASLLCVEDQWLKRLVGGWGGENGGAPALGRGGGRGEVIKKEM